MKKIEFDTAQLHELLYQVLETELDGVKVYGTASRAEQSRDQML